MSAGKEDFPLVEIIAMFEKILQSWGFPGGSCLCAVLCLVAQSCPTLWDPMDCSPSGSSVHQDSPGKNTGVGCMPSTRGSSQPRNQTQVSRTASGFLTLWATREAQWWRTYFAVGSTPGSGRSPGGGHSKPLQYSCLENPVDRAAQRITVQRVARSWTRLKY